MQQSKEKTYFPELDGLRFFAFLLVFIHHAPLLGERVFWSTLRQYGWMGVDLFLCLSAFLFTRLLYTEFQRTGSINIPYFYIRRTLRIWPLYFLFVAGMLVLTYFSEVKISSLRILGLITFTDNFFFAFMSTYRSVLFTGHLWTIAYEEQFYAIIPWALRSLFKLNSRTRAMILTGVLGFGLILRAIFIWLQVPYSAIWSLPFTHFDSILFGLAIGLGILDPILKRIPVLLTALMGLMCLWGVCLLPNVEVVSWSLMLTYFLVGLGMGLIIYSVLQASHHISLRWISSKPMTYLGKISYGLYMYHMACLGLFHYFLKVEDSNYWIWISASFILPLVVTIIISALSYAVIEKPFLRLKERFAIVLSRPA